GRCAHDETATRHVGHGKARLSSSNQIDLGGARTAVRLSNQCRPAKLDFRQGLHANASSRHGFEATLIRQIPAVEILRPIARPPPRDSGKWDRVFPRMGTMRQPLCIASYRSRDKRVYPHADERHRAIQSSADERITLLMERLRQCPSRNSSIMGVTTA